MNVYENLKIHDNPEFTEHLNEIESMDADMFNAEKILSFGEKYGILPEDVKTEILKAFTEIKQDEGYIRLCNAILYFMQHSLPETMLAPPFDDGIKAEYAMFFPVWYMAEEFACDAEKRNIPAEIISKSLASICGCIRRNAGFKGRMGTSAFFFWIPYYAKGKLFRINDFEYETAKYDGRNAVGIHIPAGTILDKKSNLLSFKEAMDFFEKYYPELDMSGLVCESWLLSREIETVMGRKTNISRFGDMFDNRVTNDSEGKDVFRFVYNLPKPCPVDELPENTSLQRNMKTFMKRGNIVRAYTGFISKEKLEHDLHELNICN